MKANSSLIVIVLDRSGSMSAVQNSTIEGFNSFITKQKDLGGECLVTFVQFDDRYEVNYEKLPATEVPLLDINNYQPRGFTALLDAVGKTIESVGAQLSRTPEAERPEKVVFVVQTDGAENASKEFTFEMIKDMITHQQDKYSWEFVFLGANIDAVQAAGQLGILATKALQYNADALSTRKAFVASSYMVSASRLGLNTDYTAAIRNATTDSNVTLEELDAQLTTELDTQDASSK